MTNGEIVGLVGMILLAIALIIERMENEKRKKSNDQALRSAPTADVERKEKP